MKNRNKLLLFIATVPLFLWQCETPNSSPDFTLSNRIDAPIISNASFKFIGGREALIDTTSNEDLADLFSVDGNNFVTLSVEEDFDFGDLDDAIPAVNVDATAFEAEVGEIELGDFSSQDDETGNLGAARFEDLTGQPPIFEEGDQIPAASSPFPVNIELETDFFVSAMIKSGGIRVAIRNQLGFDIEILEMKLFSDNVSLGTIVLSDLNYNTSQAETLMLVDNPGVDPEVELRDINVDVQISWQEQIMQADPGELIIQDIQGEDLFASQVEAVIPEQDFFSSGVSAFSDDEFTFSSPDHFVELESGELLIQNIINSIDLDIEVLEISFPELRVPPYSEADSLVINFSGNDRIQGNNPNPVTRSEDLSGVRIYALGNEVNYNIYALTEDTQADGSSDSRIIQETDLLSAEIEIRNLVIREAFGIINNKQILLNESDPATGDGVDLMNDNEAEIIEIDGISDLSSSLDGFEFTNSSLSINYFSNVDVPTAIIGAFLGVDADGNEFYLRGLAGSEFEVSPNDPTGDLLYNGSPVSNSDLIKFELDMSSDETVEKSITFNRDNTNITEFLNALPVEIRFIGLANINETGTEEGRIQNPVRFDPKIGVDIPLSIQTLDRATFTDTTSISLDGLPGDDSDLEIDEGVLTIRFENALPFLVGLELGFLDDDRELITRVPLENDDPIEIISGMVGSSGFVDESREGITRLTLNRDQFEQLSRTRYVKLEAGIETDDNQEVRVRATDSITISVDGRFTVRNRIGGN